jgi:hypothetical protein
MIDHVDMRAGCNFGNHTAIGGVRIDLTGDDAGQNLRTTIPQDNHCGSRFIATCF